MAEPGDETAAAGGRGHLRASDADREEVIGALKAAFAHGRLTKNEFDARAAQSLTARTYAELALARLPAEPAAARPLRKPARPPANMKVRTGICVVIMSAAILAVVPAAFPDNLGAFMAALLAACTGYVALVVTLTWMLRSWHQKHSGAASRRRRRAGERGRAGGSRPGRAAGPAAAG